MRAANIGAAVLRNRCEAFMRCTKLQFGRILYFKTLSIFMVDAFLITSAAAGVNYVLKSKRLAIRKFYA